MRTFLFVALLVFASLNTSRAADPARIVFDKLPVDAEVHYVAVYEPLFSGVSPKEITDGQGLVKALRVKDGPAAHIRKLLPEDAGAVLTDEVEMGRVGDDTRPSFVKAKVAHRLSGAFSTAIREKMFYDKEAFAKVELTKSLKGLVALGDKRTVFQTERMNRELLSLVFPNGLSETPTDFHTVHITVKPGKPVVLALSANIQTRWQVTIEKGGNVVGVALFGNYAKEVVGTEAPVSYAAGILPNGKRAPQAGFNVYKEDAPEFKRRKAELLEMTGKDFTSFQGQYQSGKEPFVVTPGAK